MSFAIPANESGRLEALRRYAILNTVPEVGYDEITELAAQICGCPVAVIGFVDEAQDWKKSKYGLPADFTGLPREISICSTTICGSNLLHVGDLTKDERFRDKSHEILSIRGSWVVSERARGLRAGNCCPGAVRSHVQCLS